MSIFSAQLNEGADMNEEYEHYEEMAFFSNAPANAEEVSLRKRR